MTFPTGDGLQDYLARMRQKHGVVGASFAVCRNGAVHVAADGITNLDTNIKVTPDTVFQIGSIGKLFTATQIMQLVDQGKLSLDTHVIDVLPEFAIADRDATKSITIRQLLTHTSGMEGDFFPDDDVAGPSAQSYVKKMRLLPSFFAPGEGPMTYCNSGYVVLGRIVEVLAGVPWPIAVMEQVCQPLGLSSAFCDPAQGLRFSCAMGHMGNPPAPAPVPYLMQSAAAAGTVLSMSASDLIKFGGAMSSAGSPLVGDEGVAAMQALETTLPPYTRKGMTHWGLGWMIGHHADHRVIGHDGGTLGQYAYMRIYPDHGVSFVLLTNSPSADLFEEIERAILLDVLGVNSHGDVGQGDQVPSSQIFDDFVGTYDSLASRIEVTRNPDGLHVTVHDKAFGAPDVNAALLPHAADIFTVQSDHPAMRNNAVFLRNDSGDIAFLRMGVRMFALR
ncbi:MAG: serine hydrolase domain-containing protein [Alphaproteobacteria bacterium]